MSRVTDERIAAVEFVPVAPFRERFLLLALEDETLGAKVCRRLGWTRRNGKRDSVADISRLRRTLGIIPQKSRGKVIPPRTFIPYELGVQFSELLDMDPFEAGV